MAIELPAPRKLGTRQRSSRRGRASPQMAGPACGAPGGYRTAEVTLGGVSHTGSVLERPAWGAPGVPGLSSITRGRGCKGWLAVNSSGLGPPNAAATELAGRPSSSAPALTGSTITSLSRPTAPRMTRRRGASTRGKFFFFVPPPRTPGLPSWRSPTLPQGVSSSPSSGHNSPSPRARQGPIGKRDTVLARPSGSPHLRRRSRKQRALGAKNNTQRTLPPDAPERSAQPRSWSTALRSSGRPLHHGCDAIERKALSYPVVSCSAIRAPPDLSVARALPTRRSRSPITALAAGSPLPRATSAPPSAATRPAAREAREFRQSRREPVTPPPPTRVQGRVAFVRTIRTGHAG